MDEYEAGALAWARRRILDLEGRILDLEGRIRNAVRMLEALRDEEKIEDPHAALAPAVQRLTGFNPEDGMYDTKCTPMEHQPREEKP